jgi:predicted SAM-dependent methyltransferase
VRNVQPYPYLGDLRADNVAEYLEALELDATRGLERGRAVQLLRRVSSPSRRDWAKLKTTRVLKPLEQRKAKRIAATRPTRLNVGSGPVQIPGWVSIDVVGMNADLRWDLSLGMPFPDGSVDAAFLEHVLEHFTVADALALLADCRRVLAPDGVIRLGVPDFGRYMDSYAGDRRFIEELRPNRPTPLLAVAEVALHHGHRSVWDAETLERVLTDSGFVDVRRRAFGDSVLDPAPDRPYREPETVYAEARKPLD